MTLLQFSYEHFLTAVGMLGRGASAAGIRDRVKALRVSGCPLQMPTRENLMSVVDIRDRVKALRVSGNLSKCPGGLEPVVGIRDRVKALQVSGCPPPAPTRNSP